MAHEIHKARVRDDLPPRREPYWGGPLGRGRVVGFRKIGPEVGSRIARMRGELGAKVYKALGYVAVNFDFENARTAALEWFSAQDAGVKSVETTVAGACKEYVKDRRKAKGEACARDAEARFERTI